MVCLSEANFCIDYVVSPVLHFADTTIQWREPLCRHTGNGLRNSYGVLKHSNGLVYATANGPNLSYGKVDELSKEIGCLPLFEPQSF
jgi:hypothetical protein